MNNLALLRFIFIFANILSIAVNSEINIKNAIESKLNSQNESKIFQKNLYYVFKRNDEYSITKSNLNDNSWIARAYWESENYNKTGWSLLEIETNENNDDLDQAFAAGLLEGYLTRNLISLNIINTLKEFCNDSHNICDQLYDYLSNNFKWMTEQIEENPNDTYWHQVHLVLQQFNGLFHGYIEKFLVLYPIDRFSELIDKKHKMFMQILQLQLVADLDELMLKLRDQVDPFWPTSCSALVKVLENNSDILVAHNTWERYERMLRIAKHYKFNFHLNKKDNATLVDSPGVSFTSYPGIIFSLDDFYITSSNMVITETAIGNSNVELWKYTTSQTNFYWIRNIIANRLASNGTSWVDWFSLFNSGTYNDQWLLIDYKKFKPNQMFEDGLFIIAEQLPGNMIWRDETEKLEKERYFAGYNLAYFEKTRNLSMMHDVVTTYGNLFSFEESPRANIFRRDHVKVTSVETMMKLMRYNNYTQEPYSRCECNPPYSAYLAISPRTDLNPSNGTYKYQAIGHRDHGAIDLKVTNYNRVKNLNFIGINGPTFDDVPSFVWSLSEFGNKTKHFGLVDKWTFKPYEINWNL